MSQFPEKLFFAFTIFWFLLGILFYYLFIIKKDYNFKIKYFKFAIILISFIFIGFLVILAPPLKAILIMIIGITVIMFLNYKTTQFCQKCGKTIIGQPFQKKVEYCPHCGNNLKEGIK